MFRFLTVMALLGLGLTAQAQNNALAQLQARGVTETGGDSRYSKYIVRLGANGKLGTAMLPAALTDTPYGQFIVVDPVSGADTGNGSVRQPYKTLQYATQQLPQRGIGATAYGLMPGLYASTTLDPGYSPGTTNIVLYGSGAANTYIPELNIYTASAGVVRVTMELSGVRVGILRMQNNRPVTLTLSQGAEVGEINTGYASSFTVYRSPDNNVGAYSGSGVYSNALTHSAGDVYYANGTRHTTVWDALNSLESISITVQGQTQKLTNAPAFTVTDVARAGAVTGAQALVISTALQPPATQNLATVQSLYTLMSTGMVKRLYANPTNWVEYSSGTLVEFRVDQQYYWHWDFDFIDQGLPFPLTEYHADAWNIYTQYTQEMVEYFEVFYNDGDINIANTDVPANATSIYLSGDTPRTIVYAPVPITNTVAIYYLPQAPALTQTQFSQWQATNAYTYATAIDAIYAESDVGGWIFGTAETVASTYINNHVTDPRPHPQYLVNNGGWGTNMTFRGTLTTPNTLTFSNGVTITAGLKINSTNALRITDPTGLTNAWLRLPWVN